MRRCHPDADSLPGEPSGRKLRLFACACARRVWPLFQADVFRRAVELAERLADGDVTDRDRAVLERKCEGLNPRATWNAAAATATYCLRSSAPRAAWCASHAAARAESGADEGAVRSAALRRQTDLARDIFGNPFRPVSLDPLWHTFDVQALGRGIYDARDFSAMPILADALQDAGCNNDDILNHCRGPGPHVRGCWVCDLVLGKE